MKKSELEKMIASLPPNPKAAHVWTLEQDAMLLKYAEEKGVAAIADVMGVNGQAARRRYKFLKNSIKPRK